MFLSRIRDTFTKGVGAKIALMTSGALVFVALLFLSAFSLLDVHLLSKFNLMQMLVIFVGLILFVEIVLILFTTGLFIQKPIQKLTHVMENAQSGNLLVRADVSSEDEIGELGNRFNTMLARLTELDARKIFAERELIVAQADLKFKKEIEEKACIIEATNKKLEVSLKDLSTLYTVSQALGKTLEESELIQLIDDILHSVLQMDRFSLLLSSIDDGLVVVCSRGLPGLTVGLKPNMGEGVSGRVALEKKLIVIDDLERVPVHHMSESPLSGSLVSLPLIASDHLVGVLNVFRSPFHVFEQNELRLLQAISSQIAMACDRSRLYMKTRLLAVRDELTGLYNRRHFQEVLKLEFKRAMRFKHPLSVLMIDVDHFKSFNDRFGHVHGDQILRKLAQILAQNIREVDTAARFGGEEFIVILADTNQSAAYGVAEKLREIVEAEAHRLAGVRGLPVTISVGISTYPMMASTEEELITTADEALYRAKAEGRNQSVCYNPDQADFEESRAFEVLSRRLPPTLN